MKLHDGMLVKRKDNGAKGVVQKLQGNMLKVKYHDGTHTYSTELSFEQNFILPKLEVEFEDDSKCDGVEPETIEELFGEYEPNNDSKCDGVEPDVEVYFDSDLIDNQIHYTVNGIQPIEIMKANMSSEEFHGFLIANVWKYTMRYKNKNGLDDIRKAKTYLNWLEADIEALGSDIYWKNI